MSHFVVWVLAPTAQVQELGAEEAAYDLLAPYDENIEVAEYDRPCRCGEWRARAAARTRSEQENANLMREIEQARARFGAERQALVDAGAPAEAIDQVAVRQRDHWAAHMEPVVTRIQVCEEAMYQADPLREVPDPACAECRGTGVYASTYNPKSKWDWWQVGGRWSGDFDPTGQGRDVLAVGEVIDAGDAIAVIPVAVLAPDGTWHEEGQMGWFGIIGNAKDAGEWEREVAGVMARYADHTLIVCDCHI